MASFIIIPYKLRMIADQSVTPNLCLPVVMRSLIESISEIAHISHMTFFLELDIMLVGSLIGLCFRFLALPRPKHCPIIHVNCHT